MASGIKRKFVGAACLLIASMGFALPAMAIPVPLGSVTATFCQSGWPVSASIDGSYSSVDGWAVDPQEGSDKTAAYKTSADISNTGGTVLTFKLHMLYLIDHELGRFRLAATTSSRTLYGQGAECTDSNPGGSAAWTVLQPDSVTSANGQTLTVQPDGSILASGGLPDTDVVTFRVTTQLQGITGFRLEALADSSLPYSGPGRSPSNGNFVLTELVVDQRSLVPASVPTLDSRSMALMGLLLGGIGMLGLRRRESGISR
jgi:hypothetical protein